MVSSRSKAVSSVAPSLSLSWPPTTTDQPALTWVSSVSQEHRSSTFGPHTISHAIIVLTLALSSFRLTNVSIVRLKKGGKRFEVSTTPNAHTRTAARRRAYADYWCFDLHLF